MQQALLLESAGMPLQLGLIVHLSRDGHAFLHGFAFRHSRVLTVQAF